MTSEQIDELGPVDYVIVEFPGDRASFTSEMARALNDLVEASTPDPGDRRIARGRSRQAHRGGLKCQRNPRVEPTARGRALACPALRDVRHSPTGRIDMPLRARRAARRGVIGRPVARTAAVVGTAAVVSHGVSRRRDRREDRREFREDRRDVRRR